MFRVNSCCCGCTLKTGAIIIGCLEAVGGILVILMHILQPYVNSEEKTSSEKNVTEAPKTDDDGFDEKKADVIIEVIVAAIGILFGILLIVGAVKAKTTFLRAWVFYTIATCVIVVIGSIISAIAAFVVDDIIETVLYVVFQCYFIIVVNSLYLEIKDSGIRVVYKASAPLQPV